MHKYFTRKQVKLLLDTKLAEDLGIHFCKLWV